ncbi:MAG: 23S rRNA (adenine(1618)-N(6))-methyltransferase RlmF [Gammaproteobacteria bacterium]|nr:23S rRNA (adenine(1618)-N(6))-methyltransferase RlmF [Gammaproteobacteria bacterium]
MTIKKKDHPKEKTQLHPRNKHRGRYDFAQLIESCPELSPFVKPNAYDDLSIDFFYPAAVKMLNKALLQHYYDIKNWTIPQNYLCPPIPGRADYIHYLADLLASCNQGNIPKGDKIKCLDIGVGANCIYPIIGNKEYGWSFIGADIDPVAIESANKIISSNPALKNKIEIRFQDNKNNIFQGIIKKNEFFDVSLCNPPFHASSAEAKSGTLRKLKNLTGNKNTQSILNFGGQNNELWCEGGEIQFVCEMIHQSKKFAESCFWFSTLISKKDNLKRVYQELKKVSAVKIKTIEMGQGNKISRIVAWTFLDEEQQQKWISTKWIDTNSNEL